MLLIKRDKSATNLTPSSRLVRLYGWCFPYFVIVLGGIKVFTVLQSVLNHHIVVFEFQILYETTLVSITFSLQ